MDRRHLEAAFQLNLRSRFKVGLPAALLLVLGAGLWGFWTAEHQLLLASPSDFRFVTSDRHGAPLAATTEQAPITAGDGRIPAYPGARALHVGGATLYEVPAPPDRARTVYAALLARHGWQPIAPDAILDGPGPTSSRSGLLLSYARGGRRLDAWLARASQGRRTATVLMVLPPGPPASGDPHGQPAR